MTKPFHPTPRLSAVAIASAAALLAGCAAGPTGGAGGSGDKGVPGYVSATDGRVVLSGYGQCVRNGFWVPSNAVDPCDRVAQASLPPPPPPVAAAPAVQP